MTKSKRRRGRIKPGEAPDYVWLALAEADDMWIVVASRKKPPHAFTFANMSFHRVPAKELDFGYRTVKRMLLRPEPGMKRRSKRRRRSKARRATAR